MLNNRCMHKIHNAVGQHVRGSQRRRKDERSTAIRSIRRSVSAQHRRFGCFSATTITRAASQFQSAVSGMQTVIGTELNQLKALTPLVPASDQPHLNALITQGQQAVKRASRSWPTFFFSNLYRATRKRCSESRMPLGARTGKPSTTLSPYSHFSRPTVWAILARRFTG